MAGLERTESMDAHPRDHRWRAWIGRSQSAQDVLTQGMTTGLCATLDREPTGLHAPQGIHWLCTPPRARRAQLGADGHPATGDFLPPIDLPRRMWASSRMDFLKPIAVGSRIGRTSTITDVTEKSGASGRLIFVEVDHLFTADDEPCVRESQTLVYREAARSPLVLAEASEQPHDWPWIAHWTIDPVLLFRYSALTFNGHRIHYDQPYATQVEGYPGLVAQGPLMATLMLDLCDRKLGKNRLARFSFRGVGPAFCGETLIVAGRAHGPKVDLKIFTDTGRTVMTGQGICIREPHE